MIGCITILYFDRGQIVLLIQYFDDPIIYGTRELLKNTPLLILVNYEYCCNYCNIWLNCYLLLEKRVDIEENDDKIVAYEVVFNTTWTKIDIFNEFKLWFW